ncbi:MAG: TIGR03435 family protein [Acidobacteriota bacterium]
MIRAFILCTAFAISSPHCLRAADRSPRFDAVALRLQPDRAILTLEEFSANGIHIGRGTVDFVRVTMSSMIRRAYGVAEYQLPASKWLDRSYSGRATFSPETPVEQFPLMLRTMLEERFGLRVHLATKPAKVWLLQQAPGGAKLLPPSGKPLPVPGIPVSVKPGEAKRRGNADPEREWLMMSSGTIETFCNLLAVESRRPVLDRTGLKGLFDINVEVQNAYPRRIPPPSMTLPTEPIPAPPLVIAPALKKLGLRFQESREPIDFLVVDSEPTMSPRL